MPKLTSLHLTVFNENEESKMDVESQRIQKIVIDISDKLIIEKTQLTAEVESGILDRSILEVEIVKIIDKNGYSFMERDVLIEKVFSWMFGYGPLQFLIDDEEVSDIDFTRFNHCTIKKNGKTELISVQFPDEKTFEDYVIHILTRRGGTINQNIPHCRVSDYTARLRINGSIHPRNMTGAALQIRKHPKISPDFATLIKKGMMNKDVAGELEKYSKSSAKILVTGKGAAGKTTLLRAILNRFPELEKVLLAESDTEVFPDNACVIAQRIKKKNEGGDPVTLQDLINDGLTMSLDTYVIGEMVGSEAWTIITAGLNGHRWMSSAHTNSADKAFERLLTMVKQANIDLEENILYQMFSESIDIIIHMRSYKIAEIVEVLGYDKVKGQPILNKIYEYNVKNINSDGSIEGSFGKIGSLKGRLADEFLARGYTTI